MGLIKPFMLGYVIVTIGCHVGLRTNGGTQGVGRATTNAVVAASVAVIAVDFFVDQAADYACCTSTASCGQSRSPTALQAASALARPLSTRPVVVFERVSLAFDDKAVLCEVSASPCTAGPHQDHPWGERVGKSTILKLILGLLKPDCGTIWVNGERVDTMTRAGADEGQRPTSAWCFRKARCSIR